MTNLQNYLARSFAEDVAAGRSKVPAVHGGELEKAAEIVGYASTAVDALEVGNAVSWLATGSAVGIGLSLTGVAAGMVGQWAALGAGVLEARQMVEAENFESGFSWGFAAGLLGWSGKNVLDYLGTTKIKRPTDEGHAEKAYQIHYVGLAYGFAKGAFLPADRKKAYLDELRRFAGPAINQSSIAGRKGRAIELGSKLRRHYAPLKLMEHAAKNHALAKMRKQLGW